jgi:Predicted integral membrane protein
MIAVFYLTLQLLKLYSYVVIANVVISWLIAFNVLNTTNRFVYSILEFTYKLTDPILNKIRGFLPNLGAFDISPNNSSFVDLVYRNVYEALHSTINFLIS